MQIWKDLKYGFQEKQGREGGVRQSGKFPDYFGVLASPFCGAEGLAQHAAIPEQQRRRRRDA